MSSRARTTKPVTKLKINEIFCTIQGEGYYTGTPAVFIRTSGCNLHCPFCDTRHEDGQELSVGDIVATASVFTPRHVVLTGGEPSIQPQLPELVDALHEVGFEVQIETNGTRPLPPGIDWVTCSPKILEKTIIHSPHELKVVYSGQDMQPYETLFTPQIWSLQPCDTGDATRNQQILTATIDYITLHPQWRLSLQTHKLIGIK